MRTLAVENPENIMREKREGEKGSARAEGQPVRVYWQQF